MAKATKRPERYDGEGGVYKDGDRWLVRRTDSVDGRRIRRRAATEEGGLKPSSTRCARPAGWACRCPAVRRWATTWSGGCRPKQADKVGTDDGDMSLNTAHQLPLGTWSDHQRLGYGMLRRALEPEHVERATGT